MAENTPEEQAAYDKAYMEWVAEDIAEKEAWGKLVTSTPNPGFDDCYDGGDPPELLPDGSFKDFPGVH